MKYCKTCSLWVLLLVFATGCDKPIDKKLILGEWKGAEWLIQGQSGDYDATSALFTFKPEGKYTYQYNDASESGKYYISNNELFTTPDGGIQMMVKIEKLTADSLVFNMNRGGTSETLTLIR